MQPFRTPNGAVHPDDDGRSNAKDNGRQREQTIPEQIFTNTIVRTLFTVVLAPRPECVVRGNGDDLCNEGGYHEKTEPDLRSCLDVLHVHVRLDTALFAVLLGLSVGRRSTSWWCLDENGFLKTLLALKFLVNSFKCLLSQLVIVDCSSRGWRRIVIY